MDLKKPGLVEYWLVGRSLLRRHANKKKENHSMISRTIECLLGGLLGKKDGVNVGQDSSGGNGDSSEKLVQLFVVLDGKSNVTGL